MKRSTDRILTTHCGSLPRPKDLLDLMKARLSGASYDAAYGARVRSAVSESVRKQVECGIDIPTDGEQGNGWRDSSPGQTSIFRASPPKPKRSRNITPNTWDGR